jgi:hypothetical protein
MVDADKKGLESLLGKRRDPKEKPDEHRTSTGLA